MQSSGWIKSKKKEFIWSVLATQNHYGVPLSYLSSVEVSHWRTSFQLLIMEPIFYFKQILLPQFHLYHLLVQADNQYMTMREHSRHSNEVCPLKNCTYPRYILILVTAASRYSMDIILSGNNFGAATAAHCSSSPYFKVIKWAHCTKKFHSCWQHCSVQVWKE